MLSTKSHKTAYYALFSLVGALGITGYGIVGTQNQPTYWSFIEVVELHPSWLGMMEETRLQYVEINEPIALKDAVNLSGYQNVEILECVSDVCNSIDVNADYVSENHQRIKIIVEP